MCLNQNNSCSEQIETRDKDHRFLSLDGLLDFLGLTAGSAPYDLLLKPAFPFKVSLSFAQRMRKNNWHDPLLLQVVPRAREKEARPGFVGDPVNDHGARSAPGILCKYKARCLLMVSNECAMHCRFCFRREYARSMAPHTAQEWRAAWDWIAASSSISEVVLSGGDPLCLEPSEFEQVLERLIAMPRITTVRIHTRVPIADPESMEGAMYSLITRLASHKTCIVVIHANHASEFSEQTSVCLTRLRAGGAQLLNQSVLLKGVNDAVETLADLSRALVAHGVMPYYLHQLDRVSGAWHFEVDQDKGRALMLGLRAALPGYAVPRYVKEQPGERSKLPL
ncbi:MAG: KamA family radical SAM protein [Chitinispirillaceae bacterium]|nr:KamA family radical SAM protein [Chitinispirillaceae bacterium]